MSPRYEVLYLDDNGLQQRWASYNSFEDAQHFRDDLVAQGWEAWIEDAYKPSDGSEDGGDWMNGDF